jgi:hypothetical protein
MSGIRHSMIATACTAIAFSMLATGARAQAVGFQAVPGFIPQGPVLNVTPAVSFDRRYVRLGVNPQFIANVRFQNFMVPAAVGGGPGGPGALGGIGGLRGLGGAGGGGAGGAGGGAAGGGVLAGMNGVIDPMQARVGVFGGADRSSPSIMMDSSPPARTRPAARATAKPKPATAAATPARPGTAKAANPGQPTGGTTNPPATAARKP